MLMPQRRGSGVRACPSSPPSISTGSGPVQDSSRGPRQSVDNRLARRQPPHRACTLQVMTAERKQVGMRDRRFIAEHRGRDHFEKEQHRQLMVWACHWSEHVLPLFGTPVDVRLTKALAVAKDSALGKTSVGEARNGSVGAIHAAREATEPGAIAVARSVGQAVATEHMADHLLGAARHALRAVAESGGNVEEERKWQDRQLPVEIRELVQSARQKKNI